MEYDVKQLKGLLIALDTVLSRVIRETGHHVKCQFIQTKVRACSCGQSERYAEAMRDVREVRGKIREFAYEA